MLTQTQGLQQAGSPEGASAPDPSALLPCPSLPADQKGKKKGKKKGLTLTPEQTEALARLPGCRKFLKACDTAISKSQR